MTNNNPLILALDVKTKDAAISLARDLGGLVGVFKIGPILFTRYGPEIVREIKNLDARIFLDLKLYDIPNTVAGAVDAITELGVDMITVHIAGGKEMLTAAVEHAGENTKVLGVTRLTSVAGVSEEEVVEMAIAAKNAGVHGVIASPLEARSIREAVGKDFLIVTPGVRLTKDTSCDQKRVASPADALRNGADYIVVGRPILESPDPVQTVKGILYSGGISLL